MLTRPIGFALACSLLATLTASACTPKGDDSSKPKDDPGTDPDVMVATLENTGWVCISGAADQPHTIEVNFGTCLSSSCDRLLSASCTVEQAGTELIVQAKAEVSHAQNQACTEDCGLAGTTCTTEALAAGDYTLVYANKRLDVTVPVSELACIER